jgi:hypothetical protein
MRRGNSPKGTRVPGNTGPIHREQLDFHGPVILLRGILSDVNLILATAGLELAHATRHLCNQGARLRRDPGLRNIAASRQIGFGLCNRPSPAAVHCTTLPPQTLII